MIKTFTLITLLLILLVGLEACRDNNDDDLNMVCTAQYSPAPLKFSVVNRTTGQDLFFSQDPQFATADLKIMHKGQNIPVQVNTSANNERYFSISTTTLKWGTDTLILKLGNGLNETVIYNFQNNNKTCPQPEVKSIRYNGSIENGQADKIYLLKR